MRLDRNPLRRATDRTETLVLTLLAVAFLACAPLAALAAGTGMHAVAQRAEIAQHASRYPATVTVLMTIGEPASGEYLAMEVKARWTRPDGKVLTKDVAVPIGTRPGDKLSVYQTRDGALASQPMSESRVASLTDLAGVAGVAVLALMLTVAGLLARWWLDRRRMAAWDADWATTGPRWTTRA